MARQRKHTDQQRAEALALYETDGPTAVQRQLGIPKSTVRKWARLAGRSTTSGERTRAATAAVTANAAQTRAKTALATIQAADIAVSALGRRLETEADSLSVRELAIIFGILVDKHVLLARMDQDSADHSAVDSWISHMMSGLQADYDRRHPDRT